MVNILLMKLCRESRKRVVWNARLNGVQVLDGLPISLADLLCLLTYKCHNFCMGNGVTEDDWEKKSYLAFSQTKLPDLTSRTM